MLYTVNNCDETIERLKNMKIYNCPNCEATLTVDEQGKEFTFCQYCGTKISFDDYCSTQRIVDEAKIKQTEVDKEIRLQELKIREEQERRCTETQKILIRLWICVIAIFTICSIIIWITDNGFDAAGFVACIAIPCVFAGGYLIFKFIPDRNSSTIENDGSKDGIVFPKSVFDNSELTYPVVESIVKDAGFTNVKTINMKDLKNNNAKEISTIGAITVNGKQIYSGGRRYFPSSNIIIAYHGCND